MSQAVNIYTYTAASNPYLVKCLAHKYGYTFDSTQSLGSVLQQLVAMEGEPALMEIIENNPDKELFFDYFKKKYPVEESKKESNPILDFMNFTGTQQAMNMAAENKKVTDNTSVMVLAGAVIIAIAILTTNLKK
jgi:hypothetical protein